MKTKAKAIFSILPAFAILIGAAWLYSVQPIAEAAGTLLVPEMALPAGIFGAGVWVLVILWKNHF